MRGKRVDTFYLKMINIAPDDEYVQVFDVTLRILDKIRKDVVIKTPGGYPYVIAKKIIYKLEYGYETSRDYYPSDYPNLFSAEEIKIIEWVHKVHESRRKMGKLIGVEYTNPRLDVDRGVVTLKKEWRYEIVDVDPTIDKDGNIVEKEKIGGYTVGKEEDIEVPAVLQKVKGVVRETMPVTIDMEGGLRGSTSHIAFYNIIESENMGYQWRCEIDGKSYSGIKWVKTLNIQEYRNKSDLGNGLLNYEPV